MAAKQYRVVQTTWRENGRVETDIGCAWKPEAKAREELREKQRAQPGQLFSLQKKP